MAICRRDILKIGGFALLGATGFSAPADQTVTERQKGDPDQTYESLTFSPATIRRIVTKSGKATFEKRFDNLPSAMITTARRFLGISRDTAPQQITQFLDLFGLPFNTEKGFVPFCAAGVSYSALQTFASWGRHDPSLPSTLRRIMPDVEHYYFYPTVSCVDMYHIAAGKHRWVDAKLSAAKTVPHPGWIVLFDWADTGTPDHCGIVTYATTEKISTIEFNTSGISGGSQRNGGTVSEKIRSYDKVKGFIATDL